MLGMRILQQLGPCGLASCLVVWLAGWLAWPWQGLDTGPSHTIKNYFAPIRYRGAGGAPLVALLVYYNFHDACVESQNVSKMIIFKNDMGFPWMA